MLSLYPPFMTMLHAVGVYVNTYGMNKDPKDGVVIGLICLSTFLSLLGIAHLLRWAMVGLQFPARIRQLGRRNFFYLLVVEEAIIIIPRIIVCGGAYGILQLAVPSSRMSSEVWALESQRAAQVSTLPNFRFVSRYQQCGRVLQHTAQFVAYTFVAFVAFRVLNKFF